MKSEGEWYFVQKPNKLRNFFVAGSLLLQLTFPECCELPQQQVGLHVNSGKFRSLLTDWRNFPGIGGKWWAGICSLAPVSYSRQTLDRSVQGQALVPRLGHRTRRGLEQNGFPFHDCNSGTSSGTGSDILTPAGATTAFHQQHLCQQNAATEHQQSWSCEENTLHVLQTDGFGKLCVILAAKHFRPVRLFPFFQQPFGHQLHNSGKRKQTPRRICLTELCQSVTKQKILK